jgi:hypothetical protein
LINYKKYLSLLIVPFFLTGCSLKLITKEVQKDEYNSIGNEYSLMNFGLGESYHNVNIALKESTQQSGNIIKDESKKVRVIFDHGKAVYLVTTNKEFIILNSINVGDSLDSVVESHLKSLDMFEYKESESNEKSSFVYFNSGKQKIVMLVREGVIQKIVLSGDGVPYINLIAALKGKKVSELPVISDDELKEQSNFLTFRIDISHNSRKVLLSQFKEYTELGLIPGVPFPINSRENQLFSKYGEPNYLFEGKGKVEHYYFYKRFNLFMGYDQNKKLVAFKIPVNVSKEEFEQKHGEIKHNIMEINDYVMKFKVNNGEIEEIIVTKK